MVSKHFCKSTLGKQQCVYVIRSQTIAPQDIRDILKPYATRRALRSSEANLLAVPPTRTKTYGDRAFCVAAPTLRNKLPDDLRDFNELVAFKRELKTYLFKTAYKLL